jgi:polygalacturonase
VIGFTLFFAAILTAAGAPLDVRDFGARGNGTAKDTAAIQKAIDAAARKGGGTVTVPAGRYLSGTIHLKSNVTLHLDNGATIVASPDDGDFDRYETLPFKSVSDNETTYFHYALVAAENAHDIAIVGEGEIDGNRTKRGGPKTVAIKLCERVTIRGITVRNSPNYSISLWGSDYVNIDGVTILNGYADGIDPDSCRYVRISNCFVDSHDDAICPKASPSMGMDRRRPVEHLTVTNCVLRTDANGFKFGTESSGDFRNVAVSNLTIGAREKGPRPKSGISLESVDGARIEGVLIANIAISGVETPIFVRLGNRGRGMETAVPGSLEDVSIRNVVARDSSMASSVTGQPGYPVRRVLLDGLTLGMTGGAREAKGLDVPEHAAKYPEGRMFGELPAYALYARHVEGLTVSNVRTWWEREDARPAMLFDDVRGLTVEGLRAPAASPVVWLNRVVDFIGNLPSIPGFVRVTAQ